MIPCNNQDNSFDDVIKCQLPLGHEGAHEHKTTWDNIKKRTHNEAYTNTTEED